LTIKKVDQSGKKTVLYCRLSRDDLQQDGESNSISNQKNVLERYAKENGFLNMEYFVDLYSSFLIQCNDYPV
jgi:DNA invertase Pin-like site-specific DNA recombinase